jgi:hypothetical protein
LFYAPTSRSRTSVPRSESGSRRDGRHASVWASACRIRPLEDVSASPSPTAPQALSPATTKQRAKARVQGPTIRPGSEKNRSTQRWVSTGVKKIRLLNPPRRLQSAPRPIDGGVGCLQSKSIESPYFLREVCCHGPPFRMNTVRIERVRNKCSELANHRVGGLHSFCPC